MYVLAQFFLPGPLISPLRGLSCLVWTHTREAVHEAPHEPPREAARAPGLRKNIENVGAWGGCQQLWREAFWGHEARLICRERGNIGCALLSIMAENVDDNVEWTPSNTLLLIDVLNQHPCIWQVKNKHYDWRGRMRQPWKHSVDQGWETN